MKNYKIIFAVALVAFAGVNALACDERLNGRWSCPREEEEGVEFDLKWDAESKLLSQIGKDKEVKAMLMDGNTYGEDGLEVTGECLASGEAVVTTKVSSFITLILTTKYKIIDNDNMLLSLESEDKENANPSVNCTRVKKEPNSSSSKVKK